MKPYYEHNGITIYHADCREMLPLLEPVDLVLTDPPYGLGADKRNAHSSIRDNDDWPAMEWDSAVPAPELLALIIGLAPKAIVWGGNFFGLPASQCWLVWNKPQRDFSLADAELAWTNLGGAVRCFDFNRTDGDRWHPTQKPLPLMRWCIEKAGLGDLVLDPFMGSGTTLRAAKDLGRRAIGIEIEERYCEIAAKRLSQEVLL